MNSTGIRKLVPHSRLMVLLSTSALLALGACKKGPSDADAAIARAAAMTIGTENIAIVTLGEVTSGPMLSGAILPERDATVRAQVGGSVLQTYAEQGQRATPVVDQRVQVGLQRLRLDGGRLGRVTLERAATRRLGAGGRRREGPDLERGRLHRGFLSFRNS